MEGFWNWLLKVMARTKPIATPVKLRGSFRLSLALLLVLHPVKLQAGLPDSFRLTGNAKVAVREESKKMAVAART